MIKSVLLIFLAFFISSILGQETSIVGFAPEFIGKDANIYVIEDFITLKRKKVGTGTVLKSDSSFHIKFENKEINKAIVEIENIIGFLYIDTAKTYEVIFEPKTKEAKRLTENKIALSFLNLPKDDINYKILGFDMWVDDFLFKHYYKSAINTSIVKKDSIKDNKALSDFYSELDTFKMYVDNYYKSEKDLFFLNYIKFSIAQLDDIRHSKMSNNEGIKRFETYLKHVPIYYNNEKFIQYFKSFYAEYFSTIPRSNEIEIIKAIQMASPRALWKAMAFDYRLKNPQHKELVMILALSEAYYEMIYEQSEIVTILDSLTEIARVPENRVIAKNILSEITSLTPGYPAPVIALKGDDGRPKSWYNYEGRHVYITFFETWCTECIKEMTVIKSLKEKFDGAIRFVSVCTDSDPKEYLKFRRENPQFDWDFYHIESNKNEVLNKFKIKDFPAYFLIDQDGFIVQSPADRPVPNGEYKTIDDTFEEILKALRYRNE